MKNNQRVGILILDHRYGGISILSRKLSRLVNGRLVILSPNKSINEQKGNLKINVLKLFSKRIFCSFKDIKHIDKKISLWHINYPSPLILPLFFISKKPKIITFHHMFSNPPLRLCEENKLNRLLNRFILTPINTVLLNAYLLLSEKFIFITHDQLDDFRKNIYFKKKFDEKSIVINHFIEKEKIIKHKSNFNNKILFVGRYTKIKGFEDLINVARELKEINFYLVGDNHFKPDLPNLKNIGEVENSKIFKQYDKCSTLILPSYTETWGLVILEAMARGLVVLASDLPAIREYFIEGRNGYLFPPGDVKRMKERILYLKNNPKEIERISKNNLKDIRKFTVEKQVPRYAKIYEEVLKKKNFKV